MIPLLVTLFVLSGMAGLIYESIWSRYLGLFVGHSAYAQIIVLVIFMGGMALGALAVGRRSERIREPLRAYAQVEAAVGALGLLFHSVYLAATNAALDSWFPALAGTPWLAVVKWGLAGFLILPQSMLLGATFPLMSAGVVRRAAREPGRQLGMLYFANSLGAAVGVLLSGFFLVGAVGLAGTVAIAGGLNLLVAVLVLAALGGEGEPAVASATIARPASADRRLRKGGGAVTPVETDAPGVRPLLLAVSFGTAVASFVYEIGWIRMLSLALSSATHAFEVMLSAFILGLALGAWWIHRRADRFGSPLRALGIIQWVMGSLALATLPLYLASFYWTAALVRGLGHTEQGYWLFTLARYGICLTIMLPATFCAGATLPLITRTLMAAGGGERAIGLVYGFNTLGSILGAAAAGLALMPLLGLKGLLMTGALLDVALGVGLLAFSGRSAPGSRRLATAAVAATAVVALAVAEFVRFDRLLLVSGVYRHGQVLDPGSTEVLFYRDGRTASIGVRRWRETGSVVLTSNGKPDASMEAPWFLPEAERPRAVLRGDECTQVILPLVALAHAPRARSAAVIGQGSGMASHVLLGSPHLQELETIEIEPEVIEASRRFLPANRRVFEDPRSRFVIDDAKSHFAAGRRRYDLIISVPSNPWVSGVSGLFSTEFYQRVGRHLTPDGVFGQWLHLYELNDDLALTVVAAVHENFRFYEIFLVDVTDALILATNRPIGLTPDWSVVRYPAIAADLKHIPPFSPGAFEAMRTTDRRVLAPLLGAAVRANSDFQPRLDLGAEKARFMNQVASGFIHLHGDRFALSSMMLRHPLGPSPTLFVPAPEIPRLRFLSVGAALRMEHLPTIDPRALDPRLAQGLEHKAWLQATLASGVPPTDWRVWTFEALRAEDDLHSGTAGFADAAFYDGVRRYMAQRGAPPTAWQAVEFIHAVAVWDFREAARMADPLIALAHQEQDWVPVEALLDGALAAKLLTGDRAGAARVQELLLPRSGRGPHDLRTRLAAAWFNLPSVASPSTLVR